MQLSHTENTLRPRWICSFTCWIVYGTLCNTISVMAEAAQPETSKPQTKLERRLADYLPRRAPREPDDVNDTFQSMDGFRLELLAASFLMIFS